MSKYAEFDVGNIVAPKLEIGKNLSSLYEALVTAPEERARQELLDAEKAADREYGVRVGMDKVVDRLGQYTTQDKRVAELESKEEPLTTDEKKLVDNYYDKVSSRMQELGDKITGTSLDDITIGAATSMPDNLYAQEQAIKAKVGRKTALDEEAKKLADDKLKYELASLKAGTPSSKGKSASRGYKDSKVIGTRSMTKRSDLSDTDQKTVMEVATATNMNPNYLADLAVMAKEDTSTFGGLFGKDMKVKKSDLLKLAQNEKAKEMGRYTGGTSGVNTIYANRLDGLSKGIDNRLAEVQQQREGTAGLDELDKILAIRSGGTGTSKTSKEVLGRKTEEKPKEEFVTKTELDRTQKQLEDEQIEKELDARDQESFDTETGNDNTFTTEQGTYDTTIEDNIRSRFGLKSSKEQANIDNRRTILERNLLNAERTGKKVGGKTAKQIEKELEILDKKEGNLFDRLMPSQEDVSNAVDAGVRAFYNIVPTRGSMVQDVGSLEPEAYNSIKNTWDKLPKDVQNQFGHYRKYQEAVIEAQKAQQSGKYSGNLKDYL